MKLPIITICCSFAQTLANTLQSVASQTHRDIEHIVVDGGSTDGTVGLIREHGARVAWWCSKRDRRICDAMNKELAHATDDIVGFVNSDDVFVHDRFVERTAAAMADAGFDACHADLYCTASTGRPAQRTFYARRGLYERFGGLDANSRLQVDFDLAKRFFELHRIRSRYLLWFWVRMRTSGASNAHWKKVLRGSFEAYRPYRKNGLRVPPWFIATIIRSRVGPFARRTRKPI